MGLPRPFHVWLLILSTAVSALRFREWSSYRTLVPRVGPYEPVRGVPHVGLPEPVGGGDDPSRPGPGGRGPTFPDVAPTQAEEVYNVDWEASIDSLISTEEYRIMDENTQPIDAGLEAGFRYDARDGTIAFHFEKIPNDPNEIQQGIASSDRTSFVWRIRAPDAVRQSQRSVILPNGINAQTARDAIRDGNQHLDEFIRQFARPFSRANYILELAREIESRATDFNRAQSRWLVLQLSEAFRRSRGRDAIKRKREQVLKQYYSIRGRRDILGLINNQISQPGQNSISEQSAKFQTTLNIYNALLSNVTTLLFPVLNELIENSTNPILYQMAISIYADITMVPQQLASPFKNGMTAFTDLEDQYLTKTNIKVSSNGTIDYSANQTDIIYMLAYHGLYEKVYLATWDKAINATNSTGLLSLLSRMSGYLLPADPSIAPPGWMDTPMSFLNSSADMQDIIKYANITEI